MPHFPRQKTFEITIINMEKTLQIQTQIRQNAEEISSALTEMQKWEKQMRNRDSNIKTAHSKSVRVPRAPIRSGVGTVPVHGALNPVKTISGGI